MISPNTIPMLAVEFSTEALTVVGTLIVSLTGAIVMLWRLMQKQTQDHIEDLKSRNETLQKLADAAADVAQQIVFRELKARGLPIVEPLVDVVPIRNSPVTQKAIDMAKLDTTRAKLTAVVLAAQQIPDIVLPKILTAGEVEAGPKKNGGAGSIEGEITKPGGSDPVKFSGTIEPKEQP